MRHKGGFHLVAKIIRELKSHMLPYKFKCSHWLKLEHSDWRANLVQDLFLQINFPPMRALEFIRDHVTFKLPFDFSYHMKTPYIMLYWVRLGYREIGIIAITQLFINHSSKKTEVEYTWWYSSSTTVLPIFLPVRDFFGASTKVVIGYTFSV